MEVADFRLLTQDLTSNKENEGHNGFYRLSDMSAKW